MRSFIVTSFVAALVAFGYVTDMAEAHRHGTIGRKLSVDRRSVRPYNPAKNAIKRSADVSEVSDFVVGRSAPATVYTPDDAVTFDWSGVEVRGQLTQPSAHQSLLYNVGAALVYPCVNAENGKRGNIFAFFLDDIEVDQVDLGSRFLQKTCETPTSLMFGFNLHGSHTVKIVKLTEPSYDTETDNIHNNVTFIDFDIVLIEPESVGPNAEGTVAESHRSSQVVLSRYPTKTQGSAATTLKIEFIGDSITCGAHVLCKSPHDPEVSEYTLESVRKTYNALTCEILEADACSYIAWSGRGMALNYYNSSMTVAELYKYTMATVLKNPSPIANNTHLYWDFKTFVPNIVVINLGTNDFANPEIKTKTDLFVDVYSKTLQKIANTYDSFSSMADKVSIVALCGPMRDSYCSYVQQAISAAEKESPQMRPVYFLQLDSLTTDDECTRHPDASISVTLADQLTAYIKANVLPNI